MLGFMFLGLRKLSFHTYTMSNKKIYGRNGVLVSVFDMRSQWPSWFPKKPSSDV